MFAFFSPTERQHIQAWAPTFPGDCPATPLPLFRHTNIVRFLHFSPSKTKRPSHQKLPSPPKAHSHSHAHSIHTLLVAYTKQTIKAMSAAVRALIRQSIAENPVMIFSKSYCPYCLRVKDLFDDMHVKYKALEIDEHNLGDEIQQSLKSLSGQSTVPNVYIKGNHVGGSDDTHAAQSSGKLQELLNQDVWKTQDI